jgi:DNA replication and repair protein RecF
MLRKLESDLSLDQARGFTGSGPHREDMHVEFDGHPAGLAASRGESRTAVLALKIMELDMIAAARDVAPLLLLDDVFSELDGARRKALTNYLRNYQTFITTTDADVVIQNFTESCHVIAVGG